MNKKKNYKNKRPKRNYYYATYDPYTEDGLSTGNYVNNMPSNRKPSKMENEIGTFLDRMKIFHIREYSRGDLRSPITGSKIYLDFYIPSIKLAIEYDGQHHFKNKDQVKLREQQIRDSAKNKWCKRNGIKMIRFDKNNKETYANVLLQYLNNK